jgi:hypothetical protein
VGTTATTKVKQKRRDIRFNSRVRVAVEWQQFGSCFPPPGGNVWTPEVDKMSQKEKMIRELRRLAYRIKLTASEPAV